MALPVTLQGATPRPNAGENYFHFCKRCTSDPLLKKKELAPKIFNHYSQLNFKNRDAQFFLEVERTIRKIVKKYFPELESELDEIYVKVSKAIRDGREWEYLVRNEGIKEILANMYEETGDYINQKYSSKYEAEIIDPDTLALIMATGLGAHLLRYSDPFNKHTRAHISLTIGNSNDPAEELLTWSNRRRSLAIASTEAGIAQSISEHRTMGTIKDPVKKYWIGRLDDKIRDSHLAATSEYSEGNPIFFNELFWVNGETMRHPRDYEASAKNTSNCRCYLGYLII